ncbi:MAG: methionyl-tRNA formyltransferase [Clostridiales bacterium]|nr:methionyl-tRNA formyltransferase [Clostridiales bacterium]
MNIVFMGTPDFAAANLKAISDAGHTILAAVSQPDKPVGRHSDLKPTPVKLTAQALGIPVLQPSRADDPEFLDRIRELDPELIVVTAYGKLLKPELLSIPKHGCINVHASILPRWRGAAPINWAVIEGDTEVGVTAMQMDEGLDTGDILMVRKITPAPDETGGSLFDKLSLLGGQLITDTISALEAGSLNRVPQPQEGVCYASMLNKDMGNIDWQLPAQRIERLIRGLYPWPGCYTFFNGKLLKLHKASLLTDEEYKRTIPENAVPGTCICFGTRMAVVCGSGAIELLELQPESKKRMSAADYLRGNRPQGLFGKER